MRKKTPYDWEWQQFRKRYLRAFPICAVRGCGKRAVHVDHIETVRAVPHRRLDPTNVEGLCHSHHSILTATYDSGGALPFACDEEGNPTDEAHPWAATTGADAIRLVNDRPNASPQDRARAKRKAVLGG